MLNTEQVPWQKVGTKKNIDFKQSFENFQVARKIFEQMKSRLLSINSWDNLCNNVSPTFMLTDQAGIPVERTAEAGDFIKINNPVPVYKVGREFDWIRIEKIKSYQDAEKKSEYFIMQVRPACNPENNSRHIAHLFSDKGTSSFIIELMGKEIKAEVVSRNNQPRYRPTLAIDKIRNIILSLAVIFGLSDLQWKRFIKALVIGR